MSPARKPGETHHQLSRLIESGKFTEAKQLGMSLSRKYPRDADIWYTLAGLYARLGVIDRVMDCCERVISINPGHAGALYNLAVASRQSGEARKAESSFQKCIEVDPGNVSALLGIGRLLSSEGRLNEALPYFKRATNIRPLHADAFFCLGVTLESLNDADAAMNAYRRAIHIHPGHIEAMNNIGHILNEQGKLNESLEVFNKLAQLQPGLALAHNNRGIVCESMGKLEEAEAAYRKASALAPSLAEPKTHLGFMLATEGRTTDALKLFQAALESAPDHESAIAGKAAALEKLGRIEDAFATIAPAITSGSTNPDCVLAYCKIMLRKSDPRAGIHAAERLLDTQSVPPKGIADLHFILGDLYDMAGDYPAAFSHYEKANKGSACTYIHSSHVAYIDGIIHSTGKEILNRLPKARNTSKQMVFIVGMPRSGTSLVEQILSSHPDVFGAGELRHIGDAAQSMSATRQPGKQYPDALDRLDQADIDHIAQRYIESVESDSDGSPVITDKMPHNFLYLGLVSLILPNAKIIHISRNPLDTCLSLYFHSFNPMHSYTTDLTMLGQYYCEYQRIMKHWREVLSIPLLDIRYEDIVNNPEQSTRALLEFCDLDWSDACLDFHNSGRFVKTPSYDQVRRPVYASSVNRWKRYQQFIAPLQASLGI